MKATFDVDRPITFAGLRTPLVPLYAAWTAVYRALGPVAYPEPRGQGVDASFLHGPVRQEPVSGGGLRWTREQDGRRVEADPVTSAELDRRQLVRETLHANFDRLSPRWRPEGSQDCPVPIVEPSEWGELVMEGVIDRVSLGYYILDTSRATWARHPGRWEVFVAARAIKALAGEPYLYAPKHRWWAHVVIDAWEADLRDGKHLSEWPAIAPEIERICGKPLVKKDRDGKDVWVCGEKTVTEETRKRTMHRMKRRFLGSKNRR